MNNKSGSESPFEPCGHEPPQGNSQLHGVCLFCYRDRLAHLQKLCEEQKGEIERLKEIEEAYYNEVFDENGERRASKLESQLAHLNLVLEGYKLMAGLSTTDHLKVQGMIQKELEEQKGELARIQALPEQEWLEVGAAVLGILADAARKGFAVRETDAVKAIDRGQMYVARLKAQRDEAQSQLATQTERAHRMTEALKKARQTILIFKDMADKEGWDFDVNKELEPVEQALNRDTFGDGK